MKKPNVASFELADVRVRVHNEIRMAAFAKGINRDVNLADALKIAEDMKKHGYRMCEVAQVIPAEEVMANGDIELHDIQKRVIDAADAANYYLVLDGQHRIHAASILNAELAEGQEAIVVPALQVTLQEGETIAEYITAINITKKEWRTVEYVNGAAMVRREEKLLQRYQKLIKSDGNKDGFPLSTLNIIYCNNAKALNKNSLTLLCAGKENKGGKAKKNLMPKGNIARGDRFIEICKEKGFTQKDVVKRYLAQQFSDLLNGHNEETAFKVFDTITANECQAMHKNNGNLEEELVEEQFQQIKHRLGIMDNEENVEEVGEVGE